MKMNQRIFTWVIVMAMVLSMLAFPNNGIAKAQSEIATETPTTEATATESPTIAPTEVATETPTEVPTEISMDTPTNEVTPTETPTETVSPTETDAPEVVPLIVPDSSDKIYGQYIVVFKEDADVFSKRDLVMNDVKQAGGVVFETYSASFNGFAATNVTDDSLKKIRQNEAIQYVEMDQKVHISDDGITAESTQTNPPWGLDRIDQSSLPLNNAYYFLSTSGSGVNAYIIDSGIYAANTDFGARVSLDFDDVNDGLAATAWEGHGTHVAGIIGGSAYGVAKQVNLHSIRVLDKNGDGYNSDIIAGIDYVIANAIKPAVINMSLGGNGSVTEDTAVKAAIAKGIVVVVAAGNSDANACNYSPARVPEAITVGATDSSDARAYYSNWGSCLDIFAPGSNILSDFNTGTSATTTLSGTSMAAPHVAGAAVLYLASHPTATPAQVAAALIASSGKSKVSDIKGSPNRLLYIPNVITTAPALTSPKTGYKTNTSSFLLTWNSVVDAEKYELQVGSDSGFVNIVQDQYISGTSFSNAVTSDGIYYWRVRGISASNSAGKWSSSYNFTLDTTPPVIPVLSKPLNTSSVVGNPTFIWLPSPTATKYQMQYEYTIDGNTETYAYRSPVITKTSNIAATVPSDSIVIYWQVRAADALDNWSAWSNEFSTTVLPPIPTIPKLSAPKTNAITNNSTPELSWNPVNFATAYTLQISTLSSFTSLIVEYSGLTTISKVVDSLSDGKYFWRVKAINSLAQSSKWSSPYSLTIDTANPLAPTPSKPIDGSSVIGNPTFQWLPSLTAVKYQVEYAYTNDGNPATYDYLSNEILNKVTHIPTVIPTANATIYWQVRAADAANNWSDWSTVSSVTIIPPTPVTPKLDSPAAAALLATSTPTFSWGTVVFGDYYDLQVDDQSSFANPVTLEFDNLTLTSKTVSGLADGKYYWRVRASNANGKSSNWSAPRVITIDTTAPSVPTLGTPVDNAAGIRAIPSFTWAASATANGYQFEYSNNSGFSSPVTSAILKTLNYKPTVMSSGTWYWHVRARDIAGNWSTWSSYRTLTILPAAITNGTFESGNTGWSESSSNGYLPLITNLTDVDLFGHSGYYAAWLGGGNNETSVLTQSSINSAGTRYLHFWYKITSADFCGYDYGRVSVNGNVVKTIDLCYQKRTNGWVHQMIDLQSFTGSSITLTFTVTTDGSNSSSFFVDDVSLTSSTSSSSSSVSSLSTNSVEEQNPVKHK